MYNFLRLEFFLFQKNKSSIKAISIESFWYLSRAVNFHYVIEYFFISNGMSKSITVH